MWERVEYLDKEHIVSEEFNQAWKECVIQKKGEPAKEAAPVAASTAATTPNANKEGTDNAAPAGDAAAGKGNTGKKAVVKAVVKAIRRKKEEGTTPRKKGQGDDESEIVLANKLKRKYESTVAQTTALLDMVHTQLAWSWANNAGFVSPIKNAKAAVGKVLERNQFARQFMAVPVATLRKETSSEKDSLQDCGELRRSLDAPPHRTCQGDKSATQVQSGTPVSNACAKGETYRP